MLFHIPKNGRYQSAPNLHVRTNQIDCTPVNYYLFSGQTGNSEVSCYFRVSPSNLF